MDSLVYYPFLINNGYTEIKPLYPEKSTMATKKITAEDLIDVLNAKEVWSFRQASNPNRVTNSFLGADGSRYFLTRVQTGEVDEQNKPMYKWAIGNKFRPIQEQIAAQKVDKNVSQAPSDL